MLKLLVLIALTIVILMQTVPGYCGGTRTMTLIVSATLPEHVMDNDTVGVTPLSNIAYQLIQTDTVVRNNQSIRLVSIVVP